MSLPTQEHKDVRTFIGDPPKYLFDLPEWEANDRVRRGEAIRINLGKKRRGIQIVAKAKAKEHTLAAQLSEWQATIAEENPDLWVTNGGLATLEQVEGLPVVGQAIKLFYGPRQSCRVGWSRAVDR